jgi:hypothetical protein
MSGPDSDREPKRRGLLSRRRFAALLLAAGVAAILTVRFFRWPLRRVARRLLCLDPDRRTGTGSLTESESSTLVAFGEVLLPSAFSAEAFRSGSFSAAGIVKRTVQEVAEREPGYHAEFVDAVGLLNRTSVTEAGTPFVEVDLERRRELVESLLLPFTRRPALTRALQLFHPGGRRTGRLWQFVARPILIGFYDSPLGWRFIGYPYEPGECSNLVDYQYPPST